MEIFGAYEQDIKDFIDALIEFIKALFAYFKKAEGEEDATETTV